MNIRTRHMNRKTDKRFFFEVQLNWMSGAKGVLSAADADGTVHIAMAAREDRGRRSTFS